MWSYLIDNDDNVMSVLRDSTVYMSVSFDVPSVEEKTNWILDVAKQVIMEFPEEYQSFMQSVTVPCLAEVLGKK